MSIKNRYLRYVFSLSISLLGLSFLSFFPTKNVSAGGEATIELLKRMDIQRAMTYGGLMKSQAPVQLRHLPVKALPADTDDDGMPDSWESANGLNPNDPNDAWFDPDRDEVINLFEYQLGSGLNNPASPPVATVAASGADYTDVETAIDSVALGTVIRVAAGTYQVNYITFDSVVVMIQGGWSTDFAERNIKLYPTTLDGEMQDEVLYFSVYSGEPVIILDGIHFVGGNGFFGAVNLLSSGSSFMKTSVVNCSITGNRADYSSGAVLWLTNWDTSQSDRTIANTVICGNEGSGIKAHITGDTTARWRIINSTISRNMNNGYNGYGIESFTLDNGVLTSHVYNSILWGNEQEDISISWNITFSVDHSDIGDVDAAYGAIYQPGAGVMDSDPMFEEPANDDYHLSSFSPCIDGGKNEGVPLSDFEGDPRVCGTTPDIGADEYCDGTESCIEDDTGALDIQGTSGSPGGTVSIPVRVQNAPNAVSSLGFEVVYPASILTYTGFSEGPCVEGWTLFNVTSPAPGVVRVGGLTTGNGIAVGESCYVVYLNFAIDPVCDSFYELDLQDLKDDIIGWSTSNSCVDCNVMCDINGDGEITPQDALCAFQKYMGICPTDCGPCDEILCDVNADGECTPADALEIFREYMGEPSVCSPQV